MTKKKKVKRKQRTIKKKLYVWELYSDGPCGTNLFGLYRSQIQAELKAHALNLPLSPTSWDRVKIHKREVL